MRFCFALGCLIATGCGKTSKGVSSGDASTAHGGTGSTLAGSAGSSSDGDTDAAAGAAGLAGVASASIDFVDPLPAHLALTESEPSALTDVELDYVSPDGEVVVGVSSVSAPTLDPVIDFIEAFRWTRATGSVPLGRLTDAPDARGGLSQVSGVSADGSVVVGSAVSGVDMSRAYRWTGATGMVGIGPEGHGSELVSADGSTMTITPFSNERAHRWTEETGLVELELLPGYSTSRPAALSRDGTVVTGDLEDDDNVSQPFRWSVESGMEGLGWPDGLSNCRTTGFVAEMYSTALLVKCTPPDDPGARRLFVWTEDSTFTEIDELSGFDSLSPSVTTEDGSVVFGVARIIDSEKTEVFRFTPSAGTVGLGTLPGFQSSAISALPRLRFTSADGSVLIGWSTDENGYGRGFRWTEASGMVPVAIPTGYATAYAHALSRDGKLMVGSAFLDPEDTENGAAVIWGEDGAPRLLADELAARGVRSEDALLDAYAVSENGAIVGQSAHDERHQRIFIARLY